MNLQGDGDEMPKLEGEDEEDGDEEESAQSTSKPKIEELP